MLACMGNKYCRNCKRSVSIRTEHGVVDEIPAHFKYADCPEARVGPAECVVHQHPERRHEGHDVDCKRDERENEQCPGEPGDGAVPRHGQREAVLVAALRTRKSDLAAGEIGGALSRELPHAREGHGAAV